jgi:uncharacterized iron-regulated membrane protein
MSLARTSRKLHRWLMLFIGVQLVIWSLSGAYMVLFDIDYIHGDSLVKPEQTWLQPEQLQLSLSGLFEQYPNAEHIELGHFIERPVYRFEQGGEQYLVDARSAELLSPLGASMALSLAQHMFNGEAQLAQVSLIEDNAPYELSARHLPVWRIDYNQLSQPSLYISVHSGRLVAKRHQFWRLFDWMFRFHLMDYLDGDPANNLLRFFTLLALVGCCSGLILVYFTLIKRGANSASQAGSRAGRKLASRSGSKSGAVATSKSQAKSVEAR